MAANPRVASNPVVMPDRTFTDRMTLGSGDDRTELFYFGAGHTDGDEPSACTRARHACTNAFGNSPNAPTGFSARDRVGCLPYLNPSTRYNSHSGRATS